ncbi:putative NBD/HSP70 family sugar kinase [Kineosporia succinea]|uniref:NBD/HSP70 family sugar kinase n=1 Tax=Kineosporia succinea TaxID=84632 RepID=A0ABT9PGZ8_9ACTN|nr:ROK family protein [Kineosporia succinea]MDP9831215.1 putative NBD/HSP70 family sugar kinase [Kineosporia succinea]
MPTPPLSPRALALTRFLLVHGPSSRAVLGEALQLSEATLSRVARILLDAAIVTEHSERASVGRPKQILTAVPGSRHVAGIKLTGDTAHGVRCDLAGTVVGSLELPLPARFEGAVPVDGVVAVVGELADRLGPVDGVGLSVGGVVDDRSVVRDGPFLGWRDVDLGARVRESSRRPVVLTNDVVGLAREQLWFGAGRTHDTFGVVTVGAGLGFAVVREGVVMERLIDNGHLLAHAPMDASGPPCALGHPGCVSSYLDRDVVAARSGLTGAQVTFEQLAAVDPDWLGQAARTLGHLVATVAGALQTPRIVLAGEDVNTLWASPVTVRTLRERTGGTPLEISTGPLTFEDWARGAGVAGIQGLLGAL